LVFHHGARSNHEIAGTWQADVPGLARSTHNRCADHYEQRGVDLATLPLVGIGRICRRQHTAEVDAIVRSLAQRGYRLHAFGAKTLGLARYADNIVSSDSLAWSFAARWEPPLPECHGHRNATATVDATTA